MAKEEIELGPSDPSVSEEQAAKDKFEKMSELNFKSFLYVSERKYASLPCLSGLMIVDCNYYKESLKRNNKDPHELNSLQVN